MKPRGWSIGEFGSRQSRMEGRPIAALRNPGKTASGSGVVHLAEGDAKESGDLLVRI